MKGYLLLSDGTQLEGRLIGAVQNAVGEIVFNTGMTGYQEIVTDPSYFGQIVVLTYPMIGNYGICSTRNQSKQVQVKGLIVRDMYDFEGDDFENYLLENNIVALEGIDTRFLTKHIRDNGNMLAKIVLDEKVVIDDQLDPKPAYSVSTEIPYIRGEGKYKIAVLDYGIKENIMKQLCMRDFSLKVFPATTKASEILEFNPDGIFLSNGPGDPAILTEVVEEVKAIINMKPTFGICLGHQLIGMAYGAKTEPLKFGHRGSNHPVKDIALDRVFITSQNHGYQLVSDSIEGIPFEVTHINVNDLSVEGIKHETKPIFSVQYHPEAAPGPEDSHYLFEQFETIVKEHAYV